MPAEQGVVVSRSVRLAVGVVVGVVLLMVAAVCALVGATAQAGPGLGGPPGGVTPVPAVELRDPVEVSGEVLDVDEDQGTGYASMEVAFDDGAGGTEVATVDLGLIDGTPLPAAGDRVPLVHERGDPASVLRADDPALLPPPEGDLDRDGVPDDYGRDTEGTAEEAREEAGRARARPALRGARGRRAGGRAGRGRAHRRGRAEGAGRTGPRPAAVRGGMTRSHTCADRLHNTA